MKTRVFILTLLLSLFCINSSYAQLGKALNKAKDKAKKAVTEAVKETATEKAPETVISQSTSSQTPGQRPPRNTWRSPIGPYVTDEMIEAAAILKERNSVTKPPVWVLAYRAEEGGGSTGDTRQNHANLFINLNTYTPDSIRVIKQLTEARHAENMRLFSTLKDTTGFAANQDDIKTMRAAEWRPEVVDWTEILNFGGMEDEIERYYLLMDRARDNASRYGGFARAAENKVTIPSIQVGLVRTAQVDGKTVFCRNVNGKNVITPADEELFNAEYAKYQNLAILLRKEPPAAQYPEYAGAQLAAQEITMAQKNAIAMEVKQPIPAPAMNNAALTDKMLKLAQKKYPGWGIVKLVIAESAWRPEKDALGNIIHRRINTKIILPRKSGGYIMRTLSFIEPYAGGGKYGEAQTFGIGTDETAVDYK